MDDQALFAMGWYSALLAEVRGELERRAQGRQNERPALAAEQQTLEARRRGWALTLAKPDLDPALRAAVEAEWQQSLARTAEIEALLADLDGCRVALERTLDPADAGRRRRRLQEALASGNPTLGNLELSLHLDRIDCFADGKVVLRTCKLGLIPAAIDQLAESPTDPTKPDTEREPTATYRAKPRRRAKLRTNPLTPEAADLKAAAHFAADPARFAGLGPHWFWLDILQIPEKSCWAADHAAEVARLVEADCSITEIAARLGKSPPTIRDALRRTGRSDLVVGTRPKKRARRRWAVDHAAEVDALSRKGMAMKELVEHFGKSDTTIREALRNAQRQNRPDAPEPL